MPIRIAAATLAAGLMLQPVQYSAGSRQQELDELIGSFRDSAKSSVLARGPAGIAIYDDRKLDDLLKRAATQQKGGQADGATRTLEEAYLYVEQALVRLRDKESVTYERSFRTPAEEYRYLSALYASYIQLVDRAALSGSGLTATERTLVELARTRQVEANRRSAKGDWAGASRDVDEAAQGLLRVLESQGVMAAQ